MKSDLKLAEIWYENDVFDRAIELLALIPLVGPVLTPFDCVTNVRRAESVNVRDRTHENVLEL